MKSELQKLKDGELYDYTDPEVRAAHIRAVELCDEYNETKRTETEKRERICANCSDRLGKDPLVEKNIRIDYGFNVHAGDNFFANYDCVFLDCAPITFGNNVFIAPQCGFMPSIIRSTPIFATAASKRAFPSRWATTCGSAAASR